MKKFFVGILVLGLFFSFSVSAQLMMPVTTNEGIEEKVRTLFSDAPAMIPIAKCESGFRQYNNGMPLLGGTGGNYVGVFQISKGHAPTALSLGMDIYTTDGNLAFAKYMYQKQGTQPWISCVSTPITPTPTTPSAIPIPATPVVSVAGTLTVNLKIGMTHAEIKTLQQMLNALGYTISPSGPGSPGNETTMFGSLTKAAVQKFQCEKNIACSGNESTTGYGRVGPITRSALLSAIK